MGKLRHDPFAMLPFCGYNMGDYFKHWLTLGAAAELKALPRIYSVNWFRKSDDGKFLWPGFGENARILKWIFERTDGVEHGEKTPIGIIPSSDALDLSGLSFTSEQMQALFEIKREEWLREASEMGHYLSQFNEHLPSGITDQLKQLEARLRG